MLSDEILLVQKTGFQEFRNEHDHAQADHHLLGKLDFFCQFNSLHKASVTKTQKIIQVFLTSAWISPLYAYNVPSLFSIFHFPPLFLLCLLSLICTSFAQYSESQMRQHVCCFTISCSFWFSVTPIFLFPLSVFSPLVSSFEAQMTFVCLLSSLPWFLPLSDCCCFLRPHSVLSVLICLSPCLYFFLFSTEMKGSVGCFPAHHMVVFLLVFFLPMLFSLFAVSVISLALSAFLC